MLNNGSPASLVMIVENDGLLRLELATALEDAGWTVTEADSGETALMLLAQRPSLRALITDIQLGGAVTGWDVAETARAQDEIVPVIYVSANAPDPIRQIARSTFFSKPIQLSKLLPLCAAFMPS